MSSLNSPVNIFTADDSLLMLAASLMAIVGEKQPGSSIHGIPAASPSTAARDIQFYGGFGLRVLRTVCPVASDINFLVFNSCSDPGSRKGYLGVGADGFSDKTANLTRLCMLPSKPRSKSPINPLVPVKEGVHHACRFKSFHC